MPVERNIVFIIFPLLQFHGQFPYPLQDLSNSLDDGASFPKSVVDGLKV